MAEPAAEVLQPALLEALDSVVPGKDGGEVLGGSAGLGVVGRVPLHPSGKGVVGNGLLDTVGGPGPVGLVPGHNVADAVHLVAAGPGGGGQVAFTAAAARRRLLEDLLYLGLDGGTGLIKRFLAVQFSNVRKSMSI